MQRNPGLNIKQLHDFPSLFAFPILNFVMVPAVSILLPFPEYWCYFHLIAVRVMVMQVHYIL